MVYFARKSQNIGNKQLICPEFSTCKDKNFESSLVPETHFLWECFGMIHNREQISDTSMISCTEHPRERSQYGFCKPCTIGPMAFA